jgi:cyclase
MKYLINTESHRDHFTGNFFFPEVGVIAHEKTREEILAVETDFILERVAKIDPEGLSLLAGYRTHAPSITFSERLGLHLGNHTFHLIHHPGHTRGQTSVFIPEEKVVFTGDNIFYKVQTFIFPGDPFVWLQSLKKIGELAVDYIVPGHGEVCDKTYLSEQAAFIQEWVDTVQKAIDSGWTKAEALARISMLNRYPMSIGTEDLAPEMQKKNITHLYDLLIRDRG